MVDWKDKKIGLVLSGGGAKGAYQVGMLHALERLGLTERITVISGCSIGAFNGALYAASGVDTVRGFLHSFGALLDTCCQTDPHTLDRSREAVASGRVSIEQFVGDAAYHEYDTSQYIAMLKEILPDASLMSCAIKLHICAYSLETAKPEYFDIRQLAPQEQRDLILASGSLPFVFPPVRFRGAHYLDGGAVPLICTDPAPADKIPLLPMLGEDVDVILVNFLIASDTIDHSGVPDTVRYLELRPSVPLELYPGEGTLDFSAEKLNSHEALGYRDTMELFCGRAALE